MRLSDFAAEELVMWAVVIMVARGMARQGLKIGTATQSRRAYRTCRPMAPAPSVFFWPYSAMNACNAASRHLTGRLDT